MKLLIKNGTIMDGTGKSGFYGSLLIEEGLIREIGPGIQGEFDRVIDAEGMVMCPGFIDTHSHSDLQVLVDPYIDAKIHQGITTEILGQDGISMAPLPLRYIDDWRKNLAGLDGNSNEIDWSYKTTAGYFKQLEAVGLELNEGYLAPHGNIRMEAMGLDNRLSAPSELEMMKNILRREFETGAIGLSTGLIYIPCAYADARELTELCKVTAEYNRVFVVHQRSEADDILTSMKEILDIGRKTGVKIHFSHFKLCGRKNWDKTDAVIELLEVGKRDGLEISYDQYPYTAGSTMLGVILPPWVHDGGAGKLVERLKNRNTRERIIRDIQEGIPGWDNFIDFAGLDGIYITSVANEENSLLIGKNLIELGQIRKMDPLQATFDLLVEENNAVGMVDFYGEEEGVKRFMSRPEQNVCTDGLLGGKPHPRAYGAFPRVLGKYVREEKVMTLEQAIYKMTYKAAKVFGLSDRGVLQKGKAADIVLFSPEDIIDRGTYTDPVQYPAGIRYVLVNGQVVLEDSVPCRRAAGKLIRTDAALG